VPLASEFVVGDSTVSDMTHCYLKTVAVANETLSGGAIVVPKNLFIEVAEKMERFDVDVCTLESALEQAPEVLQPVRVDLPVNVSLGVVNRLVKTIAIQSYLGHERIGIDGALFRTRTGCSTPPGGFTSSVTQIDYIRVCNQTTSCTPGTAAMIFDDEFNGPSNGAAFLN
jgi:hypothetical protein